MSSNFFVAFFGLGEQIFGLCLAYVRSKSCDRTGEHDIPKSPRRDD